MGYVLGYWIAENTGVGKFVTRAGARLVRLRGFISANAGGWRRRGSVAIGTSGVGPLARKCSGVGSIYAREGVMWENAGNACFRGSEVALVGRECMKGWHVMFWCPFVGQLVVRC